MNGLQTFSFLIIVGIGCWQRRESRLRRRAEFSAALERNKIREVAERAASDAASCAELINRMDVTPHPRRRLHAVRDEHTGKSS